MISLALTVALSALPCDATPVISKDSVPAVLERTWGPWAVSEKRATPDWMREQMHARCDFARPIAASAPTVSVPTDALKNVLARPEFERSHGSDHWLLEWLQRWLSKLSFAGESQEASTYSEVTRYIVLGMAACVALYGLYRLIRNRWARERRPREKHLEGTKFILEEPQAHQSRARSLLELHPREALRETLLLLLSALERRRWARPDRVKTNRELAAELPSRGAPTSVSENVIPLLRWYDAKFYSLEPVELATARQFLSQVETVTQSLEPTGR